MAKNLNRKFGIALLCKSFLVIVFGALPTASADTIVADAATEFSGVQGQDSWYYGYFNGPFTSSDFQEMTEFTGDYWFVNQGLYWTRIGQLDAHPNGTTTSGGRLPVEHWSVRRYVSEVSGRLRISGLIGDGNVSQGNGVIARIFVDGIQVHTTLLDDGAADVHYSLDVNALVGSTIDFIVDPRSSNDIRDTTRFTATITTVPEPNSLLLLSSLFGLVVFSRRTR